MNPTITIIGLENQNNDGGTAGVLAEKIQSYYGLTLNVRVPDGKRLRQLLHKKKLEDIVRTYLKDDHTYIIFVLDFDNPSSKSQREQEPNSFINQITAIVDQPEFHKTFFCPALWEIEAWLLVDCTGICCYYLSKERGKQYNKDNCRQKIKDDKNLPKLIKRFQKGKTENIMEPLSGKKGVKEHLRKFSEEIMRLINPNNQRGRNQRIKKEKLYREHESPLIARYLQLDKQIIRRNSSLQNFADVIRKCAELSLEEHDEST